MLENCQVDTFVLVHQSSRWISLVLVSPVWTLYVFSLAKWGFHPLGFGWTQFYLIFIFGSLNFQIGKDTNFLTSAYMALMLTWPCLNIKLCVVSTLLINSHDQDNWAKCFKFLSYFFTFHLQCLQYVHDKSLWNNNFHSGMDSVPTLQCNESLKHFTAAALLGVSYSTVIKVLNQCWWGKPIPDEESRS